MVMKSKTLALKSIVEKFGGKVVRPSKLWKSEEASYEEVCDDDYDNEVMSFIIRRKPCHFKAYNPDMQKDNFKNKFKKSLMETGDELDNEDNSEKQDGEANLAMMALISSDIEYELNFDSESNEEDEISKDHPKVGPSEIRSTEDGGLDAALLEADPVSESHP
ncbi:hypothetical protein KIW84_057339 [Lathyrus oleraceus]|uniref:Uncharacterized protein n=1 Tax=Pisum sativum TaxID=3888 RepID=A0A9D4X2W4_PEA|nr:hypothetical protein KIW84_057339 [Pisum sativum]